MITAATFDRTYKMGDNTVICVQCATPVALIWKCCLRQKSKKKKVLLLEESI